MKKIRVTQTYLPLLEDYISRLEDIWKSGWVTNYGDQEKELQSKLREYLEIDNIELVSNGTLAIQLAIRAMGLKGEIITTPFTYVATSTAIVWEGCTPVFVDIDDKTLCINPELIESAVTENTSAILGTHVYGLPCDVHRIQQIAEKHNLKVIYDAAHCFGEKFYGKSILVHGDISTLSFHATKIFHTAEGGGIVCRDEEVSKKIYLLKKFGHLGEEEYITTGINAKISELHAAMGLSVLPIVPDRIRKQKELSSIYDSMLDIGNLILPQAPPELERNYSYYPIIFPSVGVMEKVRTALINQNIFPRRYFFPSLNTLPYLQISGYQACPISEKVSNRVLCLPLYYDLDQKEVCRIANIVIKNL